MGDDHLSWRIARSSRPGTSHIAHGIPCQDANLARITRDGRGHELLLVAVSDGAGSAPFSHVGSKLICDHILGEIQHFLEGGGDIASATRADVEGWLASVLDALGTHAECHDLSPRDLAATCLGCVVGPTATVCFQIGDGAIVVDNDPTTFLPVFWPQRGEYANTTVFLSDTEAIRTAEVVVLPRQVQRVAMFSDGIQMLALHYATRTAHAPFFTGLFATLETQPPGESDALNVAMDELLDREQIVERTDDDRTLVLATRRTA